MSNPTARRLPPEWAAQSGVMLTWPHAFGDWKPLLAEVEPVFVAIARAVTRFERLLVSTHDGRHDDEIRGLLTQAGVDLTRVDLAVVASNDSWARDHGPLTVLDAAGPCLLDFRFNGWGGKYAAELDDAVTPTLHALGHFGTTPLERQELVLEGGALEVDGEGTLLTTESCLLAPTRNPQLDRVALEAELGRLLGLERVLWLSAGELAGDDTDGHVDMLARFCDPQTIVYTACDDPADPHHAPLKAMETELRAFRRRNGEPYRLLPLPWPEAKYDSAGQRLPASYANFLIINGALLVPTYRDRADAAALQLLADCFPGREVIGIDCLPLIHQFGSLHCVTMQLPAGVLPPLA